MIILRTPKGWTGPKEVDGKQTEGSWRSHQVPFAELAKKPAHLKLLDEWMKSYKPEELFDEGGTFKPELAELAPKGERRMGANPHANGGLLLRDLRMPDFRDYAVEVTKPGRLSGGGDADRARFLRDVMKRQRRENFRIVGPDETASNRLGAVFEVTDRVFTANDPADRRSHRHDGRVMEVLSEHMCQGWLEGYLLTGRHGFFSCYEAFIHIIDSMFNQHAKWLKTTRHIPVAPADRVAQLSAHLARLAAGPQRLQPPGSRLHRSRRQQEGGRRARLSAARREHAAVGRRSLPAQPQLRQRDRRRASSPRCSASTWTRRSSTAPPGIGIWEWASNDEGASRTSSWPAPATCRRSRRSPPSRSCASASPI